ncbi:hypothetical protein PENSPDRAFT_682722 [Peniophora sp. CONT]|nr:hypothetical protein PENSPDRAFT_682722 [Peniophora sp. CONT]
MLCHLFSLCYASAIYWPVVNAQNLTPPSIWNTTSYLSRESREMLASGAAAALFANGVDPSVQGDPSAGASPPDLPSLRYFSSVFSVLALQDYYSGNTTWSENVVNGMQVYYDQYGIYRPSPTIKAVNSDAVYWGLAFFYAYRTYRQTALLNLAKIIYNATYSDAFITPGVAASGNGAGRGAPFSFVGCSNLTYAGGVFWAKDAQNDTEINAETVAPFLALSAYLFEETKQAMYQGAVQLSVDFAINHMWNGTGGYFQDTIFPATCTTKSLEFTLDQWFIEGLSVWANVTKNDTLTSLLEVMVPNVAASSRWTRSDGIIIEASQGDLEAIDKGIFIRALAVARERNPGTALAQYIESYITVQFNSIVNHAVAPGTDFYTTAWAGPSSTTFNAGGNIAALDVLNAAFSFLVPSAISPSASGSGATTPQTSVAMDPRTSQTSGAQDVRGPSPAGAVVGGVAGGIIGIAAIVGALLLRRRRRIRETGAAAATPNDFAGSSSMRDTFSTQPFDLRLPVAPSSKWERFYAPGRTDVPSRSVSESALQSRPVVASGQDRGTVLETSQPSDSELPTLVSRLYNLVQGRHGELPPQYEARID